jgi:hypothetical protein
LNSKPNDSHLSTFASCQEAPNAPMKLPTFLTVFLSIKSRESRILLTMEQPPCPVSLHLKHPAKSLFKCFILVTPLCQNLLISMSSNLSPNDLRDTNCKKKHVALQPPILYRPVKSVPHSSLSTKSIKVTLASGNLMCLEVYNEGDNEKYLKHIMALNCQQKDKGPERQLLEATKFDQGGSDGYQACCEAPQCTNQENL